MHLDAALTLAELRPLEHRQTQVDGGRIESVDMTVKFEDSMNPAPASFRYHEEIRNPGTNERYAYRNTAYNINHNLKRIAEMVGVTIPLTLYVARHSWASAAKTKGIPVSVISEGMGHDSEATTQIYLASLDTSVVDRANSLILKSLR